MARTNINVNLHLDKKNNILPIRSIAQGTNNFDIVVSVFANSTAFTIPVTATARIYIKKPDSLLIYNDCTIANNKITASLTTQSTLVAGTADVEIEITDTDTTIARTTICKLDIVKSNIDNTAIESSNEFTTLQTALQTVGSIDAKLDKIGDSKDCTVTFAESATEADIASGETHSTLFGKILKSIKTFRTAIGTLANLTTTVKTSLVLAINELVSSIGILASLTTTQKSNIVGAVNEINTNLTLQSGTQTTDFQAGFTAVNCKYSKYLKLVTLNYKLNYTSITASQVLVLTIPSGFRPAYEVGFIARASGSALISVQLNADGNLYVNAASSLSSGTLSFSVTYLTV